MTDPGKITITPAGRPPFVANRYLIQNGDHKELLIYWYQGRGRSTDSEYLGKVYTVIDSVRLRRSDAAMVRITTPVRNSLSEGLLEASQLAAQASTILPEYIPD
jgi:EpsI family protein